MFDRRFLAGARAAGLGIGLSKAKLTEAMLDILVQLPVGTTGLKEVIVEHLGPMGALSATRDINDAWTQVKKKAAKLYPDRFILRDNRLLWNDGSAGEPTADTQISRANFVKLNDLAAAEGCSVNALVGRLIKIYQERRNA